MTMVKKSAIFEDPSHTFVIAEAGSNWKMGSYKQDLAMAKKLIKEASKAGADAIKFQTFTAEDLTSIHSKYYKLFKKLELSIQDFDELSSFAKKQKIIFLSDSRDLIMISIARSISSEHFSNSLILFNHSSSCISSIKGRDDRE